MVEAFFRYVARALALILAKWADPSLDAKLKAFNQKVAAVDARAKEAALEAQKSEAQYLESVRNREAWDKLIVESREAEKESESRLRASQDRVKEIEAKAAKLKSDIDAKSDDEKVRLDL